MSLPRVLNWHCLIHSQEASKFMRHSKRTKLSVDDINAALRVKNVEPLYGYTCGEAPKFRKTTVNANDIYFDDDEEVDFDSVLNKPLPKIPLDVTFTAHWLAIEGVQPAIPQNPTPSGKPMSSESVGRVY